MEVGTDEWIVSNDNLFTNDITACVAIALVDPQHPHIRGLYHLHAKHILDGKNSAYKNLLDDFLENYYTMRDEQTDDRVTPLATLVGGNYDVVEGNFVQGIALRAPVRNLSPVMAYLWERKLPLTAYGGDPLATKTVAINSSGEVHFSEYVPNWYKDAHLLSLRN